MARYKENEYTITLVELDRMLEIASEENIPFDTFEGTLLDNHIIYNDVDDGIFVEGKTAKYILIEERYLNSWSSELVLILTDSDEEMEEFRSRFEDEEGDE